MTAGQLTRTGSYRGAATANRVLGAPRLSNRRRPRRTTYMLGFNREKVLQLGGDDDRPNLIRFGPGGWENLIA